MMKEPEEAIEKVLAGLRSTSAPIGMDRRIMEALEARASVRSRWGWRRWAVASLYPRSAGFTKWSLAGAVVCAVALLVTANHWLTHVESPSKRSWNSVSPLPAATSEFAVSSLTVIPVQSGVRQRKTTRPERKESVGKPEVVDDSESLALEEMRAASQPPPPAPLTDQEKLLLRIARRGDPVEVAALNPVVRAARYEEEKAEVQRFFKSARPGDSE